MELDRQNTKIADLLQRAVSEIQPIAAEKELTIAIQCTDFEFDVDGDRLMRRCCSTCYPTPSSTRREELPP